MNEQLQSEPRRAVNAFNPSQAEPATAGCGSQPSGGHLLLLLVLIVLTATNMAAQPASPPAPPKYEVRAAWITTLYALDWPKTKATSPESMRRQQEELISMLDRLQAAGFNTVLFQARTRGDVTYNSRIEPYSSVLTGTSGRSPGYDPLAFVVEECHRRGMECHAWMVALPLGSTRHARSLGNRSVTRQQPGICLTYGSGHFLNPAHPKTKEYLASLICEVVEQYDVDGIHLDYLRYPEKAGSFPDAADYRRYGKGRSREQWRRDNLTNILRHVYREVKARKPWVKVSTCPVGKYADTSRYPSGGWNALNTVYQDPVAWLREGIQDQIYPMMYFRGNSFYPFALDWVEQSAGRQVVPGLGIYFLDPREGDWKVDEVERQVRFLRQHGLSGQGHYRTEFLMNNIQGLYDLLRSRYYTHPALVPPMTWLDSIPPTAPTNLTIVALSEGYWQLSWQASTDNPGPSAGSSQPAPTYVVYAADGHAPNTSDPTNILASGLRDTTFIYAPDRPWDVRTHFTVTAVDRYGNESRAAETVVSDREP